MLNIPTKKGRILLRKLTGRTEAVVRLHALRHNIQNIQNRLHDGCRMMAVLKGDGYGHGLQQIYPTLLDAGITDFAVAIWEEGRMLRQAGCTGQILILGDTCDDCLEQLVVHHLTPTIFCLDTAEKLNEIAKKYGCIQPVHIKIDTGMSRIGFPADSRALAPIAAINRMEHLQITGAFTHFARADEPDGIAATAQAEAYRSVIGQLEDMGIHIPFLHVSNSPAILLHPQMQMDAVRAGDILYGLNPVDDDLWLKEDFQQVMHWYTQVAMVKEVPAGTQVGYGGTFTTRRPTTIATIPVGFADGYNRRLSNRGKVRIHNQDAPIIGRVCMDQFMVDVSDIPGVKRGDTVALLDDQVSILWMANLLDANVDEIVCNISKRVPRVYEQNPTSGGNL